MKQLTLQPQQTRVQRGNNSFSSSSVASWAALGISNALSNLFKTLEGKTALNSPHVLSWEARELQLFESRLKEAFGYHVAPSQPFNFLLSPTKSSPTGTAAQEDTALEWVHFYTINAIIPTVYSSCSVSNQGSTQCQQFHGFGPCCIILPLTNNQFWKGSQNSMDFQKSLSSWQTMRFPHMNWICDYK